MKKNEDMKTKKENKIEERIKTLIITAFGDWGEFIITAYDKNPMPDGSHITEKYVKKIHSLLKAQKKEYKKQIIEANEAGYERGHSDGFDLSNKHFKEKLLALKEKVEEMKKKVVANDNEYPDARWQRENYGSKKFNQALKDILKLIEEKLTTSDYGSEKKL